MTILVPSGDQTGALGWGPGWSGDLRKFESVEVWALGRAVRLALSFWYLIGTVAGLRRSVGRDEHLSGEARRASVNLFLGVAGLGWAGKAKRCAKVY